MVIITNTTTPPTLYLVELTCPFTRNIEAANNRKRTRYKFLASDIKDAGYQCKNLPFEIVIAILVVDIIIVVPFVVAAYILFACGKKKFN